MTNTLTPGKISVTPEGLGLDDLLASPGGFEVYLPLGFDAGDGNLYRYVGNDPTNLVDPTGEKGKSFLPTGPIDGAVLSGALERIKAWAESNPGNLDAQAILKLANEFAKAGKLHWASGADLLTKAEYIDSDKDKNQAPFLDHILINKQAALKDMGTVETQAKEYKDVKTFTNSQGKSITIRSNPAETEEEYQNRMTQMLTDYVAIRLVHELTHALDERDNGAGTSKEEESRTWVNEHSIYSFLNKKNGYQDRILSYRFKQINNTNKANNFDCAQDAEAVKAGKPSREFFGALKQEPFYRIKPDSRTNYVQPSPILPSN